MLVGVVGVAGLGLRSVDRDGSAPPAAAAPLPVSASTAATSISTPPAVVAPPAEQPPATRRPVAEPITVPARGPGTYRHARLGLAAPRGSGRVIRFDVRVEKGLALDPKTVARQIHATLADKRSWRATDHVRFQLVSDPSRARLHAYVVTPRTTDRLCYPWMTRGQVSCQNGNRVVLNARRWVFGAKAYGKDVTSYREYLVNHEFGHALGYNHVRCHGKGRRAPVMMQQTKGLHGCRPNPWPAVARR
ncbi:hypothetical protein GCM10022236_26800 [Microlunatus ginsengisoli]|uniref:DUF3152 domain-containing protein n=1 Tax=Microlunatus ginsengisoli TaxID=363863 RepID=A0ABP7A077_9ACTN